MLQKLRMPLQQSIKGEDVLQTFDKAEEEASSTFPKGKNMKTVVFYHTFMKQKGK